LPAVQFRRNHAAARRASAPRQGAGRNRIGGPHGDRLAKHRGRSVGAGQLGFIDRRTVAKAVMPGTVALAGRYAVQRRQPWQTIRQKGGARDRSRISISEDYEVRYWSRKFRVSPE